MFGTRCASKARVGACVGSPAQDQSSQSVARQRWFGHPIRIRLVQAILTFSLVISVLPVLAEDVRVRIQEVKSSISLSGMGVRYPGVPRTAGPAFQALRVHWTADPAGLYAWKIEDRDTGQVLSRFRSKTFEVSGSHLRLDLKSVPDRLSLIPKGDSSKGAVRADLVATMDIESYIRGVLPAEMPKTWPLESLKAQAVAARTYAMYRKRMRKNASYHLESTVMDQVFQHSLLVSEHASLANVERAVRETKGIILKDHESKVFATYFHADCGGHTEEASAVWGQGRTLGTVVDRACPMSPLARWEAEFKLDEVVARLRPKRLKSNIKVAIEAVETTGRLKSGRVDKVKVKWSDGETSLISGHKFRMALGHDRIKSTNFSIAENSGARIKISGRGHGHGVGLCQWGARHLAGEGKNFKEILRHYYPKAEISLNAAPVERLQAELD